MRIIKPSHEKEKQMYCPKCGALIGYYPYEVHCITLIPPYQSRWRYHPGIYMNGITCPNCNKDIEIK